MNAQDTEKYYVELTKGKDVTEFGLWQIKGANQSAGGFYDRDFYPDLGIVQGTYEQAVRHALTFNSFFGWSGAGTVTPVIPTILWV